MKPLVKTFGRPLAVLVLAVLVFGLSSALVVYAAAPASSPPEPLLVTPTATAVPITADVVEPAIVHDIVGETPLGPTAAPPIQAAPSAPSAPAVPNPPAPVQPAQPAQLAQAHPLVPVNRELIVNGNFEAGFVNGIGVGWSPFASSDVQAGWADDTWPAVVYEGQHAQLMFLKEAQWRDRFVGIWQSVAVVPNAQYELSLRGLVRSDHGSVEKSNYGYRLQYGIDYRGGTDWQSPDITWVELPWDEQARSDPPAPTGYRFESYATTVTAQSDRLTLFIRGWQKWPGVWEGNYDVDAVSLVPKAEPPAGQAAPAPPPDAPMFVPITGTKAAGAETDATQLVTSMALLAMAVSGGVWKLTRRR